MALITFARSGKDVDGTEYDEFTCEPFRLINLYMPFHISENHHTMCTLGKCTYHPQFHTYNVRRDASSLERRDIEQNYRKVSQMQKTLHQLGRPPNTNYPVYSGYFLRHRAPHARAKEKAAEDGFRTMGRFEISLHLNLLQDVRIDYGTTYEHGSLDDIGLHSTLSCTISTFRIYYYTYSRMVDGSMRGDLLRARSLRMYPSEILATPSTFGQNIWDLSDSDEDVFCDSDTE